MALTKILNDENKSYKPVLTDKLVYDTKPTVSSFNGITSDAVARAIAGASGDVPAVTESDNGKVLTAVYDEGGPAVEWADAQGGGGAEYSAGTGISISAQDEISVDTTVIATKNDLSSYQPTISDLETIRSGASAGATAVQPGSLATVATSGSYNDLSNKPSIPAAQVNSDWNAASGVSQILNKPSLATVATSGSYADLSNKPTIPTVDQSYNAASTNAQSGTAVAQAIAAIPSSSYTAGDGIDITANEVSVRAGRNLGFESQSTTVTLQSPTYSSNRYAFLGKLDADTVAQLKSGTLSLTPKYDYTISLSGVIDSGARFAICQSSGYNQPLGNGKWVISNNVISGSGITSFTLTANTAYTVDFSSLSSKSTGTWTDVEAAPTNFYLALVSYSSQYTLADVVQFGTTSAISYAQNPGDVSTLTIGDPNALYLYAEDQLPSISGNGGKVLKVNAGATAVEWAAEATELPATLGTAGQVLTVNSGATGVEWATPSGGGGSNITIGTTPDGWQSLTAVCGYAPQGPMTAVFGYNGSALTTAENVQFGSGPDDVYGFITPTYHTGYQDQTVYVVLFYPYSYNNTSFNDFVFGPSIGLYNPYNVHQYNSAIPFTDEMKAFIASRQYPSSVGIGLYAGDKSESTLTMDNLCKFVSRSDSSVIANDASWVKVAGSYVNKINGMPAGLPSFNTYTDVGKVLTVTANGLAWVLPA